MRERFLIFLDMIFEVLNVEYTQIDPTTIFPILGILQIALETALSALGSIFEIAISGLGSLLDSAISGLGSLLDATLGLIKDVLDDLLSAIGEHRSVFEQIYFDIVNKSSDELFERLEKVGYLCGYLY